jgi:DNA-binding beta-propeller fold protein YncE
MEIAYSAPQGVTAAVAALGRTEDLRFSPSDRRLAVAAFARNRIAVLDLEITSSPGGTRIAFTGGVEVASPALQRPHGLDFIDDDTLIVTSRGGDVALFKLPPGEADVPSREVHPMATWPAGRATLLNAPGSVAVVRVDEDACEILICNNAAHNVTRHLVDRKTGGLIGKSRVLLQKHLDIPDGVAVSADRRWIAVSNHNTHNLLLYENSPGLNKDADPDGILRRVHYPHGLCFSPDGRYLFVADAGAPCVNVYARGADEWRGVHHPVAAVRIMDEAAFERGRHNREEGGPKGLDIDSGSNVLAVTSECQSLAFFDVPALLKHALAGGAGSEQQMLDISYELSLMQEREKIARRATEALRKSTSWRITAPLRRLGAIVRRLTPLL